MNLTEVACRADETIGFIMALLVLAPFGVYQLCLGIRWVIKHVRVEILP